MALKSEQKSQSRMFGDERAIKSKTMFGVAAAAESTIEGKQQQSALGFCQSAAMQPCLAQRNSPLKTESKRNSAN